MNELLLTYPELKYILLLIGLFLLPRLLDRYGIPGPITSLTAGFLASAGLHLFHDDPVIPFLSGLGIVALFLFAGLEVDARELRDKAPALAGHLAIRVFTIALGTIGAIYLAELPWRPALLLSLAVFTPSTGFILDTVGKLGLSAEEEDWVKSKAIASELLALAALFVVMNSADALRLTGAALVLGVMTALLPSAFRFYARAVPQESARTDFVFLIAVALTCALITRLLGAYYLVGAFLVGLVTQRVQAELPNRFGHRVMEAVEMFGAFFIPFYFFKAGLHIEATDLGATALFAGALLVLVGVPFRVAEVAVHRLGWMRESYADALRVSVPLLPTLVFTLVIAEILRDEFQLPPFVFGALVVYAVFNTIVPAMFFRVPSTYDEPTAVHDDLHPEHP